MASVDLQAFSTVVEKIYDAAVTPGLWGDVAGRVADLHASPYCILFAVHLPGVEVGFAFPHGLNDEAQAMWASGYAQKEIWMNRSVARGMVTDGNVMRGEDILPDDEFFASEYYRDFLHRFDVRYLLSGVMFGGNSRDMPAAACSVMRRHAQSTYAADDVALHRMVVNHLSKALGTMWKLRVAEMELASTYAALERLDRGVILLDASGSATFINEAARRLLVADDGVRIRSSGTGRETLAFRSPEDQARFEAMVRSATAADRAQPTAHFLHGLKVSRPSGKLDFVIQVSPLGQHASFGAGTEHRAIAFVSDPSAKAAPSESLLGDVYRLTPAESRLAVELLSGDSLATIAQRLGVSHETARTHLASIFEKTGTNRQAQLVRMLAALQSGAPGTGAS